MGLRAYLEVLGGVVACVYGAVVLAWVRVELSAVDFDGGEVEGAVGKLFVAAVLPLHYAFRTSGLLGCGDVSCEPCLVDAACPHVMGSLDLDGERTICNGAVVGRLVEAVGCEGVADSGVLGLNEPLVDGVVEALWCYISLNLSMMAAREVRTSPVRVALDLLLQVPTRSAAGMVWACTCKSATPESSSAANEDNMVGS
jgi:hypothetical protein